MKAQINLFLKDDNSFRGIYDGSPIEMASMLHRMASDSNELKSALLIAAAAVFKDYQRPDLEQAVRKIVITINQDQ
jgi:hypothetical protein